MVFPEKLINILRLAPVLSGLLPLWLLFKSCATHWRKARLERQIRTMRRQRAGK